ncbi:MAG: aldo/keto reductase [Fimbriimonadaceae bacterium]|nr:aldo/keto reductase [Fimbriimonadaceae bacterium]
MIPKAPLPGADLEISRLVIGGTMILGEGTEAVYERYLELGGNAFDTAEIYGLGKATARVGDFIKAHGAGDQVHFFEKGCHPYGRPRVTPEDMEDHLTAEAARLHRDCVDFFVYHRDDPSVPVEPLVEKAAEWIRDGRIRGMGASNWTIPRIEAYNAAAQKIGFPGFLFNNPNLSLATVNEPMWEEALTIDAEGQAWHARTGFPLLSWSASGGGWFARVDSADVNRVYDNPVNRARRDRAEELGRSLGMSATQIALAYTLNRPFPTWAAVGPRTPDELDGLVEAARLTLTPEQLTWLETGG